MTWFAWITFAVVAVGACVAVRRPIVGLLVFLWLDFMRPHDFVANAGWFRPMLIIGVVTAASAAWHQRQALRDHWRTLLPFVTLLAVLALSALLGNDPPRSAARVLLAGKGVLLVWLCVVLIDRHERFIAGVWVIALSVLCLAAYAAVESIERGTMTEFSAATAVRGPGAEHGGPLTDNNDLARVLVVAVPLWWLLAGSKDGRGRRRAIAYLGCVGTVIGVACTFSRGAFLALMTAVAAVMLYDFAWPRVALLLLLGLGLIVAVAPQSYSRRVVSIVAPVDSSFQQRLQVWKVGLARLRSDPFLGTGPGTFRSGEQLRSSHNIFVEVLSESGIVGLAAYLWVLAGVFQVLRRSYRVASAPTHGRRRAAVAVGASLLAYLVASLALGGAYQTRMFELIGLALALDSGNTERG